MTGILGGDRSIQLSYEDLYKKLADTQILQVIKLLPLHYYDIQTPATKKCCAVR